jgi:hypothetical protein
VIEGPGVRGSTATSWSPDGKYIIIDGPAAEDSAATSNEDMFAVPTTGKRVRQLAIGTAATEESGVVSPDGRWLAYNSNDAGIVQVYIRPFLAPGARTLISGGGGTQPVWVSARELAYRNEDSDSLVVASLAFTPALRVVSRTSLFSFATYARGNRSARSYDVSRDGRRFLLLRPLGRSTDAPPVVVLHWSEEVRRRFAEQGTPR